MAVKRLVGPHGVELVLDTSEVFTDDPGAGTPAMVYYWGGSATYWCALGEGEVTKSNGETIPLPEASQRWLIEQENLVEDFLYRQDHAEDNDEDLSEASDNGPST